MLLSFRLLCAFVLQKPSVVVASKTSNDPLVHLDAGVRIKGSILRSLNGRPIYAFRGIPYAEPPVGQLRFKAPVPKKTWPAMQIDAAADGPPCIQYEMFLKSFEGQEDCLYLNVYSTKFAVAKRKFTNVDEKDEPLAVMVYIHGGGFAFGNGGSSIYGPQALLDADIVLVTFNYRLGPLGFLSTGDQEAPGNYGLLDQSLALRWIQDHIGAFGGDARRVTIVGESAGAVSVGYHLLSPLSTGLFHAAIAMSGSPLCSWGFQKDPKYWSQRLSSDVHCPVNTSADLIHCLRTVQAEDLVRKASDYTVMAVVPLPFVPNLDGIFLLEDPRISITTGNIINKVPYLSGITKDEGATIYAVLQTEFSTTALTYEFMKTFLAYLIDDRGNFPSADLILNQYLSPDDQSDTKQFRKAVINVISDGMFKMCHYETIALLPKAGIKTYTYSFDYSAQNSMTKLFGIQENIGVGHLDDLFLLFEGKLFRAASLMGKDKKIMEALQSLWTNFFKHSNPTPPEASFGRQPWKECTPGRTSIYHIDDPVAVSSLNISQDELFQFWTFRVAKSLEEENAEKNQKDEL